MVVRHKGREIARPFLDTRPLRAESHWTENFSRSLFYYTCIRLAGSSSISHVDCRPVNKHFSFYYSAESLGASHVGSGVHE